MIRFLATVVRLTPAALAVLAAVAWQVRFDLTEPYRSYPQESVELEVSPGAPGAEIVRRMDEDGVVPSHLLLRLYLRWSGRGADLHAGEYRFEGALSPLEAIERILRGDVLLHRLTIPEGWDLSEIEELLAGTGYWSDSAVREALSDVSLLENVAPEATSLEGFLFPETYSFSRTSSAGQLVASMVDRFATVFDEPLREQARLRGLSVLEAVTLASLIEDEVRVSEEAPLVASVIHNRLERGMKLEIDATVIYALKREGRYTPPLLRRHLSFDSPWNTYVYQGIPPGPISSPGEVSLKAIVRPAESDYFYYVLKPDGSGRHEFSKNFRQHQAAVRRLRAAQ